MKGTLRHRSCRANVAASLRYALLGAALLAGAPRSLGGDPPPPPPPPIVVPVAPLFQTGDQTRLDHSPVTIDQFGCTLVTWTMLINQQSAKNHINDAQGNPVVYTPAQINTLLNDYRYTYRERDGTPRAVNGWGQPIDPGTGQLIGDPPTTAPPLNIGGLLGAVEADTRTRTGTALRLRNLTSRDFPTGANLNTDPIRQSVIDRLTDGDAVPVRVADNTGNEGHSVLITSFHSRDPNDPNSRDRWDIRDPFGSANNSSLWLDEAPYRNRVFATDAAVFQAGGLVDPYTTPSPYWFDPLDLYDPLVNPDQFAPYYAVESFVTLPSPGTGALLAIGGLLAMRRRR